VAQSVDTEGDAGPPPSDGLTLVGDAKRFLQRWQRLMLATDEWDPEQVVALRQQSRELEARAKAADMSGLAHHLQSCEHCFWNGEVDRAKLALCLRNVSEVAWQWRHDLRWRSDVLSVEHHGEVLEDHLTIDPPTLLTPPSVELFESSPPPEPDVEPPIEWQSLEAWRRPSLWSRIRSRVGPRSRADAGEQAAGNDVDERAEPEPDGPLLLQPGSDAGDVLDDDDRERSGLRASPSARAVPLPRQVKPWWSASLGVVGIVGIGAVIWVLGGSREPLSAAPVRDGEGPAARGGDVAVPRLPREAIERLRDVAHGFGGLESPELADWLDEEAAELGRAAGPCTPGALGCPVVSTARGLSVADPATSARASWLDGLDPPGIGVKDEPFTRQVFEFHTQNAVGRETLQELLFRCAPHREMTLVALGRYGLPLDLLALPMAASGCLSDAESADGVRGSWQLSLAAAKAYHLRVKPQVVDERLDPARSTEAAVRLLEDLYRKLGSWELALAAHRLGPLALLARLHDAGDDVDYETLVKTGTLPDDTVKYVRKVQALALVLTNLQRFRFQPVPARAPESTATIEVPPGTRLGLVARAAASSTTKIRELNPSLLGDRVPDWPGERFVLRVPKDAELRAREVLPELMASSDHADECVPHAFDWGRQRFTSAMASRCEHAAASP
jgi:transglycosylase-like protein with SLT domain